MAVHLILVKKSEHVESEKDWMVVRMLENMKKKGQGDVFHCLIFGGVSHSDFFVKAFKNSRVALQLKASFLNSNLKNIKSQDLKTSKLTKV